MIKSSNIFWSFPGFPSVWSGICLPSPIWYLSAEPDFYDVCKHCNLQQNWPTKHPSYINNRALLLKSVYHGNSIWRMNPTDGGWVSRYREIRRAMWEGQASALRPSPRLVLSFSGISSPSLSSHHC